VLSVERENSLDVRIKTSLDTGRLLDPDQDPVSDGDNASNDE
jgi:hypothetical protein